MSERKSWDIQPSRRSPARSAPSARPTPQPVQRAAPPRAPENRPTHPTTRKPSSPARRPAVEKPQPVRAHRTEKIPQGKDREPLKARRRRARRRAQVILSIIFVLLIIGAFVFIWLPAFRIQHVDAAGTDADALQGVAQQTLAGTIDYVVPRNSIFFFPEDAIRSAILSQYPDITAVSISRTSFSSIALDSVPREAALMWCGSTYTAGSDVTAPAESDETDARSTDASSTDFSGTSSVPAPSQIPTCYNADGQGFIFSAVSPGYDSASSTDMLHVYGALTGSSTDPIGSSIADASNITNALEFVKAIKSLGVPIVALVLRGDEADLYAQSGTRITYVLGQEHDAAQLAASAFPSMNLNDGSLEYVDLRFAGKVYFKKVGDNSQSSSDDTSGQ